MSIRTSPEAEEAVSELLGEVCGGEVSSFTEAESGRTTVTAFLERRPAGFEGMRARLEAGLDWIVACGLNPGGRGRGGGWEVSLRRVRREDWAESWKRHFRALEVGSRLLVRPSWSRRRARRGQAVVVLDPGLSFGTGQHPTTAFCLEELVRRRRPDREQSFLDAGTGSGILAIAAAKLGYGPVEGFDLEPEAVRNARENARRNGVADRIGFRRQDLRRVARRPARRYSVVCANLVASVLISERDRLVARLADDGVLVLAGILASEFAEVRQVYEGSGLKLVASRRVGEWRSGAFGRRRGSVGALKR